MKVEHYILAAKPEHGKPLTLSLRSQSLLRGWRFGENFETMPVTIKV